ncbi:hypothetical protein BU17DRAFT_75025 [Hysterangium stoloniferum]|nr:hypothetical protein BU17DRAFT_75025 [Hysterangium stoloniferum]
MDDGSEQSAQLDAPRVAQWVDEDDIDASGVDQEESTVDDVEDYFVSRTIHVEHLSKLPLGAIVKAREAVNRPDSNSDEESESSDSSENSQDGHVEEGSNGSPRPKERRLVAHRSNKHAPMEVSSKKPITRRRQVVEMQRVKPRDPRFSDLTGLLSENHFRSQYGFLPELHKSELTTLKESLSRARKLLISSPRHLREERQQEVQRLEQAVKRAESTVNRERREEAERKALEKINKEEKDKRKTGKKNWWLKDADKKAVRVRARLDAIAESGGKRAVKKAIEKKQKKIGQKEKKSRPFLRPEHSDGSRKHQREESGNSERRSSKRPRVDR